LAHALSTELRIKSRTRFWSPAFIETLVMWASLPNLQGCSPTLQFLASSSFGLGQILTARAERREWF
jgi:hypothetical protein